MLNPIPSRPAKDPGGAAASGACSSRRRRATAVAALLLSAFVGIQAPAARAASRPPNIVIFLADDLGYSDLGSYGGEIDTPNLDRLAQDGVRFSQFYVMPRCSPTRAALLTGLYPHEVGMGHLNRAWRHPGYRGELSPNSATLPEVLRSVGYASYMAGKWHLAHNPKPQGGDGQGSWPLARGFDRFFGTIRGSGSYFEPASLVRDTTLVEPQGEDFYYTDAISASATRFVTQHLSDPSSSRRPFLLYVAYTAPHWPLHARQEDVDRYRGRYDPGWDVLRDRRYRRMQEMGLLDSDWSLAPRDPKTPAWDETPHKAWQARRMEVYAAMVERMDRGIGRVVQVLTASGVLDDTLVLFLSDNGGNAEEFRGLTRLGKYTMPLPKTGRAGGPMRFGSDPDVLPGPDDTFQTTGRGWASLSNTPFRLSKHFTHEGGIATPFIVHWPRGLPVPPGSILRAPGHVVDLLPTLLEVSGAEYPQERQGHRVPPLRGESLLPLLRGESRQRGPMFWEHEGHRAVRQGRWKLVSRWPGGWELYDMAADRTELEDLAAEHPEVVEALARRYEQYAQSTRVGPWPWVVPYVTRPLMGLGIVLLAWLALRFRRRHRRRAQDPGR